MINEYADDTHREQAEELAVAGAECNTVIELKPEHHAALPWSFA